MVYEQPINTVHTEAHKKSHFPHFSSTVVFHLQSKSSKRLSGGGGREPSLSRECWLRRPPRDPEHLPPPAQASPAPPAGKSVPRDLA